VDDVQDGQYVEMNVAMVPEEDLLGQKEDEEWSADSDADSPASPPKEENGFTSDTDSDSTISTSSGSSSNAEEDQNGKRQSGKGQNRKGQNGSQEQQPQPRKRPLVQDITDGAAASKATRMDSNGSS